MRREGGTEADPVYRINTRTAFAAHTRGGWRAVGRDADGRLAPGTSATFAVWDAAGPLAGGLPALGDGDRLPVCRRTVLRGEVIYDAEPA